MRLTQSKPELEIGGLHSQIFPEIFYEIAANETLEKPPCLSSIQIITEILTLPSQRVLRESLRHHSGSLPSRSISTVDPASSGHWDAKTEHNEKCLCQIMYHCKVCSYLKK